MRAERQKNYKLKSGVKEETSDQKSEELAALISLVETPIPECSFIASSLTKFLWDTGSSTYLVNDPSFPHASALGVVSLRTADQSIMKCAGTGSFFWQAR